MSHFYRVEGCSDGTAVCRVLWDGRETRGSTIVERHARSNIAHERVRELNRALWTAHAHGL